MHCNRAQAKLCSNGSKNGNVDDTLQRMLEAAEVSKWCTGHCLIRLLRSAMWQTNNVQNTALSEPVRSQTLSCKLA